MEPSFCCDCGVKLVKPTANFCPKGHSKSHPGTPKREKTIKRENQDQDRHSDDDDNDDIQVVSSSEFKPNLRSIPPISALKEARSKAIQRDSSRATSDRTQGSYGIRPANENTLKKTVVIWLCERPPARPQQLDLPQILGTKDSLHLCIPVERKQHETNPPASKPSRRSRVESISDTQGSTSKRPQSGTRTSKKEVDTKVNIKAKKEVKQEIKVEYDSEIDVDSDVDSKDNWEAKQEDILGSVDANDGLLDEDIVSDINDLEEKLKEQGKEGLSRRRQANNPIQIWEITRY
ncbi:hypothetical protein BGZ57DRAFT_994220 [Hyaloscypha finlandica]|nr:hypothetical protein BGZ57DRAFT_994220 [Hyaloscypha finlandica]